MKPETIWELLKPLFVPPPAQPAPLNEQPRLPILIADDKLNDATQLAWTLERSRYKYRKEEIEIVTSIRDLRLALDRRKFGILFLDNYFPGEIGGVKLSREIESNPAYDHMRVLHYLGDMEAMKEMGPSTYFEGIGKGERLNEATERALSRVLGNGNHVTDPRITRLSVAMQLSTLMLGILLGIIATAVYFSRFVLNH